MKQRMKNASGQVFVWERRQAADTGYEYSHIDHLGWHLEVCHEPDNMGNYQWKATNRSTLGIVELYGIGDTTSSAQEMALGYVELVDE